MTQYTVLTGNDDTVTIGNGGGIVMADAGDDTITGGDGRDMIIGGSGADTISGGGSGDVLRGGSGDDDIDGGSGNDIISGDEGNDDIDGGSGNDYIHGGDGHDTLTGGSGNDVFLFLENSGNDTITDFTIGEDTIDFSMIPAQISYGDLKKTAFEDEDGNQIGVTISHSEFGSITLMGYTSADLNANHAVMFNFPTLPDYFYREYDTDEGVSMDRPLDPYEGSGYSDFVIHNSDSTTINMNAGNDTLFAGEGDDKIDGGSGNDKLYGEEGDDTIHGGAGSDLMYGGSGEDTFVFKAGHGDDTIGDFTNGEDTIAIDISGLTGITQFSDLTITDNGGSAVIDLTGSGGGTIELTGFDMNDLDATDFTFYDSTMEPDGF